MLINSGVSKKFIPIPELIPIAIGQFTIPLQFVSFPFFQFFHSSIFPFFHSSPMTIDYRPKGVRTTTGSPYGWMTND